MIQIVSKYEFLTGKDVLSEKDLLEKAEYSTEKDEKSLNIYHQVVSSKNKPVLQKNCIKNETRLLYLIKRKEVKQKPKKLSCQIQSTVVTLLFTNTTTLKNFLLNVLLI